MKRVRQAIFFLLAAAMIAAMSVSCGNSSGGEGKKSEYDFGGRVIRYAAWWEREPVAGSSDKTDRVIQRTKDLEKKYNCTFEYVNIPFEQYSENFVSSTLAGNPSADIYEMHIQWFYPSYVSKGYLADLESLNVFDFDQPKWNPIIRKYGTYKGHVYGMAPGKQSPTSGVWWNKSLFARDGLPDLYELQRTNQWTWEKLREIAIKASRDTDGKDGVDQWGLDSGPEVFVHSNNASVVGMDDNGKPFFGLTNPNAVEALQFYQDLKTKDNIFFTAEAGSSWDSGMQNFIAGKTAMYAGPWWIIGSLKDAMKDEFGLVFFPKGPKASNYTGSLSGFNLQVISSAADKPDEIARFWNDFTDPYEEDDPEEYRISLSETVPDEGSLETVLKQLDEQLYTLNIAESFPDLLTLTGTIYGYVSTGQMTAQAAVDTASPRAISILEDAMAALEK